MLELPRSAWEALLTTATTAQETFDRTLFYRIFPDKTQVYPDGSTFHARELYPRHLEHMRAGATYRERCFMAANRVGKTFCGGYEATCHLTGEYPAWWDGRLFPRATRGWAAGKTNETTRDIVQKTLLGDVVALPGGRKGFSGTGIIPGAAIRSVTWKQGVADLADTVRIKHKSGALSTLGFKSYQQGRGSFEGTAQDFIWLDEEPPSDVYEECLTRTATTNGLVNITFTPLEGLSEVVIQFIPAEQRPS